MVPHIPLPLPANVIPSPELTPEEEAAKAAKEKAEQDALPYKWTQTIGDLDITISIPGNLKAKDLVIDIKKQKLVAGVKGQDPFIDVQSLPFKENLKMTSY